MNDRRIECPAPGGETMTPEFRVERTDGSSAPGEKHDGCEYFILDVTHDPHALPALEAYAASCERDYPLLARDLRLMRDAKAIAAIRGVFDGDPRGERR
jgi:hypothetical protein